MCQDGVKLNSRSVGDMSLVTLSLGVHKTYQERSFGTPNVWPNIRCVVTCDTSCHSCVRPRPCRALSHMSVSPPVLQCWQHYVLSVSLLCSSVDVGVNVSASLHQYQSLCHHRLTVSLSESLGQNHVILCDRWSFIMRIIADS